MNAAALHKWWDRPSFRCTEFRRCHIRGIVNCQAVRQCIHRRKRDTHIALIFISMCSLAQHLVLWQLWCVLWHKICPSGISMFSLAHHSGLMVISMSSPAQHLVFWQLACVHSVLSIWYNSRYQHVVQTSLCRPIPVAGLLNCEINRLGPCCQGWLRCALPNMHWVGNV